MCLFPNGVLRKMIGWKRSLCSLGFNLNLCNLILFSYSKILLFLIKRLFACVMDIPRLSDYFFSTQKLFVHLWILGWGSKITSKNTMQMFYKYWWEDEILSWISRARRWFSKEKYLYNNFWISVLKEDFLRCHVLPAQ